MARRPGEAPALTVCSNCYDLLQVAQVRGRYRGVQALAIERVAALITASSHPLIMVQDRKHTLNPEFFDPARPKTDIQFLVARVRMDSATGAALGKGRLHPMSAVGQLSAAAFITPWKTLVDEANGSAAPRAD